MSIRWWAAAVAVLWAACAYDPFGLPERREGRQGTPRDAGDAPPDSGGEPDAGEPSGADASQDDAGDAAPGDGGDALDAGGADAGAEDAGWDGVDAGPFDAGPPAATVPGAPTAVAAELDGTDALVTWGAPLDDGGSALLGYLVRRSDQGGEQSTDALEHLAAAIPSGILVTFEVAAINAQGSGAWAQSNAVKYTDAEWAEWPPLPDSPYDYVIGAGFVEDQATGRLWHRAPIAGQTRAQASAACGSSTIGGLTGWRLPTAIELLSLGDENRRAPAIDTNAFPSTPGVEFLASTPYAGDEGRAWIVHFGAPAAYTTEWGQAAAVRCVRCVDAEACRAGTLPAGAPLGRYSIAADAVDDLRTGLLWARDQLLLTWNEADAYCAGLVLAGHEDWRLPTKKELDTLVDRRRVHPAIDVEAFPGTSGESWASTEYGTPSARWTMDFETGAHGAGTLIPTAETRSARCVARKDR